MKNLLLLSFLILFITPIQGQSTFEDIENIQIIRDKWSVPHIIAPTDEEVAYGLAWAQCEDDFVTIQEQMLAIRGKLGTVRGKDGAIADFAIKFMKLREVAAANYQQELSPKMILIIEHFATGINTFAKANPKEVLNNDIFPIEVPDLVVGYMLGLVEISGAGNDLRRIMDGSIVNFLNQDAEKGSNGIAINPNKTHNGETYLAINSHQPLEGWYSWYEAHLISEEGTNILGGTFPGGLNIFHGVNEHLGWAHTVNHADFSDVFQLKMHPTKKLYYEIDGEWKKLKEEELKTSVKIAGFLKIPIKRTIYESDFGTTFKTEHGFFAWKFKAQEAVRAVEQWYEMNKATSYTEFRKALEKRSIPCSNIVFADKDHNIFYVSNGSFPNRKTGLDWTKVVSAHSSDVLYNNDIDVPFGDIPQVLNPSCGYVFNTNNTPYSCTCSDENPAPKSHQSFSSYQPKIAENLRSRRFLELIAQYDTLTYEDFKRIKFDQTYPSNLGIPKANNLEDLFSINPTEYPEITDVLLLLNDWNRTTTPDNETALLFIKIVTNLSDIMKANAPLDFDNQLTTEQFVEAITAAKQEMLTKYGSLQISLGDIQRHSRGNVDLPIGGGPDILAAIYTKEREDGKQRAIAGESYIALVRFQNDGLPIIETINCYGTSAEPNSPHYTDQMEMFVNQQLKPMTLDKEAVLKEAVRVYHPKRLVK